MQKINALGVAATTALAAAAFAQNASAATASWSCRGSAVEAQLGTNSRIAPLVSDRSPCADGSVGVPNLGQATGLAAAVTAQTAYAITGVTPTTAKPLAQLVGASAGVEGLELKAIPGLTIGVDAARSTVTGTCADGKPKLTGTSTVVKLRVNGQEVALDGTLSSLVDPITNSPLGMLVQVKLNEQASDAAGLTQRAAHVVVLPSAGAAPLADVVIAESRVASASACDPAATGNADASARTGGGQGSATDASTGGPQVCPAGSEFAESRGLCVIPAAASGGQGTIVVGVPYSGPSGGRVLSLTQARKRYRSPCLAGAGPKFVTVGTKGNDRITGTNRADRILGLGGNDAIDGGRSDDCLDGGTGSDNLAGGIGNDRVYGTSGADHLNGGPGTDRLSAGTGNDSINTAFGQDLVLAGSGSDFVNAATAGKPARISCGSGFDKVRLNGNERRRSVGCEVRYVLRDR